MQTHKFRLRRDGETFCYIVDTSTGEVLASYRIWDDEDERETVIEESNHFPNP